jgi:hypothetical protein
MPRKRKLASIADAASTTDIGKARLLTLGDLDGRTASAKRARALANDMENDLGGADTLSAAQRVLVRRAAAAVAVAEHLEALWISGHAIDVSALTTLTNTISRVCGQLGLQRVAKDVTPSIRDVIAEIAAEKAKAAPPGCTTGSPTTAPDLGASIDAPTAPTVPPLPAVNG